MPAPQPRLPRRPCCAPADEEEDEEEDDDGDGDGDGGQERQRQLLVRRMGYLAAKACRDPEPPTRFMEDLDMMRVWMDGYEQYQNDAAGAIQAPEGGGSLQSPASVQTAPLRSLNPRKPRRKNSSLADPLPPGTEPLFAAHAEMSSQTYSYVSAYFILPDDGLKAVVRAEMAKIIDGMTDAVFDSYWGAGQHKQAARRGGCALVASCARSARAKICARVREALYEMHGAFCAARTCLLAVVTAPRRLSTQADGGQDHQHVHWRRRKSGGAV